METFGVKLPSPKELEEKTRKVMDACERYHRGECDCTAASALTQCEVNALLGGCVDECEGDDPEGCACAIDQSHKLGHDRKNDSEPFGYYCHACDGFTTQRDHAERHWSALGYISLYRHPIEMTSAEGCRPISATSSQGECGQETPEISQK